MSKVSACRENLVQRLQSIAELGEAKVVSVEDPDDLASYFKGVTATPVAGVVYEGMRAAPEFSQAPKGYATAAVFAVYLLMGSPAMSKATSQGQRAMDMLDTMRTKVLGGTAPAGHPWKFLLESYVDSSKGNTLWLQRWETAIINAPT